MKILFLSQRFLLPMDAGGKIRTGNILKQLAKEHEITLISNVESSKDDPYLPQMKIFCGKFIPVPWQELQKYSIKFYVRLLLNLFSRYPVSVLNDSSKSLRAAVEHEISTNNYDLAICDFVQSALNLKNISNIPTLLFQHNVESEIARRHFKKSKNIFAKIFWYIQWKKMFKFERVQCRKFDTVIAVSENDKKLFQTNYNLKNVCTIPTGVDVDYFVPVANHSKNASLVFYGSMDWLPNEDAITYFIEKIFPTIKAQIPEIKVTVVGRNPSFSLHKLIKQYPEIALTGWVQDIRPYLAESSVYIVPVRIGGGTRMKIFEAMAMGKAIVSTSVGAEGLPLENGKHIIIADTPADFAQKVIELLRDKGKRAFMERTAADYVRNNFTWEKVALKFSKICQRIAAQNSTDKLNTFSLNVVTPQSLV